MLRRAGQVISASTDFRFDPVEFTRSLTPFIVTMIPIIQPLDRQADSGLCFRMNGVQGKQLLRELLIRTVITAVSTVAFFGLRWGVGVLLAG